MTTIRYYWADQNRSALIRSVVEEDGTLIETTIQRTSEAFRAVPKEEIGTLPRWRTLPQAKADLTAFVEREAQQLVNVIVVDTFRKAGRGVGEINTAWRTIMMSGEDFAPARAAILALENARDVKRAQIAALPDMAAAESYNLDAGWPV